MKSEIFNYFRACRIHLLCWAVFICYEILVIGIIAGRFGTFWDYLTYYAINICLFYSHLYLVMPLSVRYSHKFKSIALIIITCELMVYMYLILIADLILRGSSTLDLNPVSNHNLSSIFRGIYFLGFSTGIYFINKYAIEKIDRAKIEQKNLEIELAAAKTREELKEAKYAHLKAQINPHFIFNVLNFVYARIRQKDAKSSQAILSISQMMHFAFNPKNISPKVMLLEEIIQLENLIALYKLINGGKVYMNVTYNEQIKSISFIPLIILTLGENIFKHGDVSDSKKPAIVSLRYDNEILLIETKNLINSCRKPVSSGIGLQNIKERLKDMYGKNANISYQAKGEYYLTSIEINMPFT